MRLTVMEVLAQAAAEITADLPAGVVEVRLRGRDPELVVDVPRAPPPCTRQPPAPPAPPRADEEPRTTGASPASLSASRSRSRPAPRSSPPSSGHSLNAWIVNALRAATTQRAVNVDIDLSSFPFSRPAGPPPRRIHERLGVTRP